MTDTTAKVRSKGLDSTGVTEEIANQMYAHKGKHYMAIVEVVVEERHEKAGGQKRVDLVIEQFEPAVDDALAEHLRELTRTVYQNRAIADGQATLDDTLTPDLKDAIAAGGQHEPHPFLPTDAADDTAGCEVCALGETAAPHRAYSMDQVPDPFEAPPTDRDVDDDLAEAEQEQPVPS